MKQNLKWATVAFSFLFGLAACSDDSNLPSSDPVDPMTENLILLKEKEFPSDANQKSFFVLNEDWFGHDKGTINLFMPNGEISYRAYRKANPEKLFGVTSQFGAVYGKNLYVVSKQGNRLVAADKHSLKEVATHTDLGGYGDGRAFVGITPEKGYISSNAGIQVVDLTSSELGELIDLPKNTEIGNMVHIGKYVFATGRKNTFVIDSESDKFVQTLDIDSPGSVVISKDGNVWVGNPNSLFRINPVTLEKVEVQNISNTPIRGTWFAWNRNSFIASPVDNVLYWSTAGMFGGGKRITKYDIDTNELTSEFFVLGSDKDYNINKDFLNESESPTQLAFYGGTLGINPLDGKLYATVKRDDWGDSGSYNWLFIIDKNGVVEKTTPIGDDTNKEMETKDQKYYWFPSMPLFNDHYDPEILLEKIALLKGEPATLNLNDLVYDPDNLACLIQTTVEFKNETTLLEHSQKDNELTLVGLQAGECELKITTVSNGVRVEKTIPISII